MDTNIELSRLKYHFFFRNKTTELEEDRIQTKTKIVKYDFYSVNEAQISDKIKVFPYYFKNYSIIDNYEFINISQLNEKYIEKLNNDKIRYLSFNTFLFDFKTIKLLIFTIIESFSNLLNSLSLLNDNNICFFNLCPQNIVFLYECREKPILQNFQYSLQFSKLNESYFSKIIADLDDFYIYKPLEVHVIFYLIKNQLNTISYSFIEEICEIYINNLTILSFFSDKYIESYKQLCIDSLKKYINKSKSEIIEELLENIYTWDIFSLSVLYLHIIGNILQIFSLQDTFINKLFMELSKNINPEPSKRYDLETMREIYDKLFNEEKCWKYINNLKNNTIIKLFENLQK
jgi:hypothetical protein